METIGNIAGAASKAIWGDNETRAEEPISGNQGAGTVNQPFDKGNQDVQDATHAGTTGTTGTTGATGLSGVGSHSTSTNAGPHNSNFANKIDPNVDSDRDGSHTVGTSGTTGTTGTSGLSGSNTHSHSTSTNAGPHDSNLANKADPTVDSDRDGSKNAGLSNTTSHNPSGTTGGPASHNTPPTSGVSTHADARSGPSEATGSDAAGDPKSGQKVEQKQQGAANPGAQPDKKKDGKPELPHTDSQREELVNSGKEFPRDPNDHSGEPMKMHGGKAEDAEEAGAASGAGEKVAEGKKDRSASVSQEGGNPHGKQLGTGEQYVKATGMAADGGDFDATKPGAGAEATRLLEEKGVHREGGHAPPSAPEDSKKDAKHAHKDHKDDKEKVPLGEKIKQKLHIGSKDKEEKH